MDAITANSFMRCIILAFLHDGHGFGWIRANTSQMWQEALDEMEEALDKTERD